MNTDDQKSPRSKLALLINGYEGYVTPKMRVKSSEIFEKFLIDRVTLIHKFLEKKYDEFSKNANMHSLMFPLSRTIKIFIDCKKQLQFSKEQLQYFYQELRIARDKENKLYELDYVILKDVSSVVDKITTFNLVSPAYLLKFNEVVLRLKDNLAKRHDYVYKMNEELQSIIEKLHIPLREIAERQATLETYDELQSLLYKNSFRYQSYRDIMECFRKHAPEYFDIDDNIPVLNVYQDSLLFLEKFEWFQQRLINFLNKANPQTDEEKEEFNHLQERCKYFPDFSRQKNLLMSALRTAEEKATHRKVLETKVKKANILYEIGYELETKMIYPMAIEFYSYAYRVDSKYAEAQKAVARCTKKSSQVSDFQKATQMFLSGELAKAKTLYEKIINNVSELEPEVSSMISRIESLEKFDE